VASIDRTAYPRFKRVVSARELAESFTPTAEEITWARGRTQTEGHLLSLVVLLNGVTRLGLVVWRPPRWGAGNNRAVSPATASSFLNAAGRLSG